MVKLPASFTTSDVTKDEAKDGAKDEVDETVLKRKRHKLVSGGAGGPAEKVCEDFGPETRGRMTWLRGRSGETCEETCEESEIVKVVARQKVIVSMNLRLIACMIFTKDIVFTDID